MLLALICLIVCAVYVLDLVQSVVRSDREVKDINRRLRAGGYKEVRASAETTR